jgi:hypothetical protein
MRHADPIRLQGWRNVSPWPDPEYRTRENVGKRLVHFVLKAKTVFSPIFFACGTFSTFLYGNGSHSNRVTVTPDRAIPAV